MKGEVNPKNKIYDILFKVNGSFIDEISRQERYFKVAALHFNEALTELVKSINPNYIEYQIMPLNETEIKEPITHLLWVYDERPIDTLFVQVIKYEELSSNGAS